jgi:hypothetical protein
MALCRLRLPFLAGACGQYVAFAPSGPSVLGRPVGVYRTMALTRTCVVPKQGGTSFFGIAPCA